MANILADIGRGGGLSGAVDNLANKARQLRMDQEAESQKSFENQLAVNRDIRAREQHISTMQNQALSRQLTNEQLNAVRIKLQEQKAQLEADNKVVPANTLAQKSPYLYRQAELAGVINYADDGTPYYRAGAGKEFLKSQLTTPSTIKTLALERRAMTKNALDNMTSQVVGLRDKLISKGKDPRQDPEYMKMAQEYASLNDQYQQALQTDADLNATKIELLKSGKFTPDSVETWWKTGQGLVPSTTSIGSSTNLAKLINERQALIDQGVPLDDPRVQAYDAKINGVEINPNEMTPEEIDYFGAIYNLTGKIPSLGRGKAAAQIRQKIAKSAAKQATGAAAPTAGQAAAGTVGKQAGLKANQTALTKIQTQYDTMGSFVTNLAAQVDRVGEIAKDIGSFDTRLLNVPLRSIRGRIKGSPLQAKYDMYLAEIESEIGKLSTGSTASVAELSQGAQERWAKIHDKNLSINDMLELLKETKHAGQLRLQSVGTQLDKIKNRIRGRNTSSTPERPAIATDYKAKYGLE